MLSARVGAVMILVFGSPSAARIGAAVVLVLLKLSEAHIDFVGIFMRLFDAWQTVPYDYPTDDERER